MIKPNSPADSGKVQRQTTPTQFVTRLAQSQDQERVRSILTGFGLPLDGLGNTQIWILDSGNGDIAGTAGLEVCGKQGLLRSVAVSRKFQKQGCGTALANFVVGEARKAGINQLYLLTTTAQLFFGKLGFKKFSREKVTGDITMSAEFERAFPKTAVLMRLNLCT